MLIHDNSGELKYFPYNLYKIEDVPIVAYSPNMNAYAERFVKTIRNELLDHFIIFSERQLRKLVKEYQTYYNEYRPHQGIGNQIPARPPPSQETNTNTNTNGEIKNKPMLFGLTNHYYRTSV